MDVHLPGSQSLVVAELRAQLKAVARMKMAVVGRCQNFYFGTGGVGAFVVAARKQEEARQQGQYILAVHGVFVYKCLFSGRTLLCNTIRPARSVASGRVYALKEAVAGGPRKKRVSGRLIVKKEGAAGLNS